MTVVVRRIAGIPVRSSTQTWQFVAGLLAPEGSDARKELLRVTTIGAMLIAEEYTKDAPIILAGAGPRVRIYTLHGTPEVEGDQCSELPLQFVPTVGDWVVSLPAMGSDIQAAASGLATISKRITVRDVAKGANQITASVHREDNLPTVNLEELHRS